MASKYFEEISKTTKRINVLYKYYSHLADILIE